MGENTKISWSDHTWNGWIGCTKVSTEASGGGACDFCYAERDFDLRKHVAKWGVGQPRHRTKTWGEPAKWNRKAKDFFSEHGHWPRVFANSLSDFFDNEVPREWQALALEVVKTTRNLRWMLTTKRAVNIPKIVPPEFFRDNQHVGVIISICNQMEADRDIPRILELKARLGIAWVGLSIEPMLGPITLERIRAIKFNESVDIVIDALRGRVGAAWKGRDTVPHHDIGTRIDWVICGGESGPHARPMHPDWARSLRDQCAATNVAFHFKQHGEFLPFDDAINLDGVDVHRHQTCGFWPGDPHGNPQMLRVGKKAAGRLLDGVEHNGFPAQL